MIGPKDSIKTVITQYPSVKNIYEARHIVDDDLIDTECFCERYNVPFFDLWMAISRETTKIDAEKRNKEKEIERARLREIVQERNSKFRKINFKTMTKDEKMFFLTSLIFFIIGGSLLFIFFASTALFAFVFGGIFFCLSIYMLIAFVLKKEPRPQQDKMRKFKDMTNGERIKFVFALIILLGGAILFFVSYHYNFGRFWESLGIGLALYGSGAEMKLTRMDREK